jgi:hypothetical protein
MPTSLFVRNYTDKELKISIIGAEKAFFDTDQYASVLGKVLSNSKLAIHACQSGDSLKLGLDSTTNTLIVPAKSTAEIYFSRYRILEMNEEYRLIINGQEFRDELNECIEEHKRVFSINVISDEKTGNLALKVGKNTFH